MSAPGVELARPAEDTGVRTAARAIADTLAGYGVDRVFCVAGESYLALLDALADTPGMDVVTSRHEGSAGFAALADAKLTRRPGVCLVNRGPGATNASIAVHSASQDATPLVLVMGHVRRAEMGRGVFQELDAHAAFAGMAKGVWTVHDPSRAAEITARALRVAQSGTPGPTVVVVPEDVLTEPCAEVVRPVPARPAPPDDADVRACAAMLTQARRPVLIAGDRLSDGTGRDALARAAAHLTIPVLASNKRPDLLGDDDPHYVGHLNIATQPAQRRLLAEADLVLAVGTRLDSVTTQSHRFPAPHQRLVHVYPDAARLGHVHPADLALPVDPALFLDALCAVTGPVRIGPLRIGLVPAAERAEWLGRLREVHDEAGRWHPVTAPDGVVFGAVVAMADLLAPADALFTVDAGNFTSWVHRYLRMSGSRRLLGVASSAMGFGIPAGVAAAARHPRRPVVVFVGDGGFLMSGSELATAVARDLWLVIVVANNGSYGTIRQHQERAYPGRVVATDLANPDFAALARAFGATGRTVRDPREIGPALTSVLRCEGPAVLDVRTSLEWISAYQHLPGLGAAATRTPGGAA
jgi:acetolactate synthase-1/2/3 large subunit